MMEQRPPEQERIMTTPEDDHLLAFYESVYLSTHLAPTSFGTPHIPKKIHFVWIGPFDIPPRSQKAMQSWVRLHSDWSCFLWTDKARPPLKGIKQLPIERLAFSRTQKLYDFSSSLTEKVHLLRCEILSREGGVYVDCDVEARKPFDELHTALDFYCGLEPLAPSLLGSAVLPSLHVIGAAPGHPIIVETLDLIAASWNAIDRLFPNSDTDSMLYRIAHRTVAPFEEAVKLHLDSSDHTNVVFPAHYFSQMPGAHGLYASHSKEQSWLKGKTKFEREMYKRLERLSRITLLFILISLITLVAAVALFVFVYIQRRRRGAA